VTLVRTAIHCARYFLGLDEPETQVTRDERELLARHVAKRRRAVEIGVFEGSTTRFLAEQMDREGELYAIDPFFGGRFGICWGELIARGEMRKSRGARIHAINALSFDAARIISGRFDFIFLDGDHSIEGITRDWSDWADRVQPMGIFALHDTSVPDYNPDVASLGTVRFFNEVIQHDARFDHIEQIDSLNVLRRRATDSAGHPC
jgi:predicted O-methyltransferase YrrM